MASPMMRSVSSPQPARRFVPCSKTGGPAASSRPAGVLTVASASRRDTLLSVAAIVLLSPASVALAADTGMEGRLPLPPPSPAKVLVNTANVPVNQPLLTIMTETKQVIAASDALAADANMLLASSVGALPAEERNLLEQIREAAKLVSKASNEVLVRQQFRLAQAAVASPALPAPAPVSAVEVKRAEAAAIAWERARQPGQVEWKDHKHEDSYWSGVVQLFITDFLTLMSRWQTVCNECA
ncbi:hypothetical protein FOA52_000184 [Chlamydomonas sp. UWO 241]|nr:hypothetical protein FOA52_000184 [Chlamydomonas sp. UWO 241]